jgi:hypothetical protein
MLTTQPARQTEKYMQNPRPRPHEKSATQTILKFELAEDPLATIDPIAFASYVVFGPLCFT